MGRTFWWLGDGGDSENKFSTPRQRILLMYNPLDRRSYPVDRQCSWKDTIFSQSNRVMSEYDAKEELNMLAAIFPGGHGLRMNILPTDSFHPYA